MRSVVRSLNLRGRRGAEQVRQKVGAGTAVLNDRGEVLLIRRRDNARRDLPGGGVNVGEDVGAAARRELREETGLTAGPLTLLGVFSGDAHRHTYPDGNEVAWVTVLYLARQTTGEVQAGDDAAQVAWWPLAKLPEDVSAATGAYFQALRASAQGAA